MANSIAEAIVSGMGDDEKYDEEETEGEEKALGPNGVGMVAAMEEFMEAVSARKPVDAATCLKHFFELCEEEPHEEGPHIGEE